MKKLKSSLTNMVLVLTGIAIVAGAALAAINAVTAPQIEKINADNLKAGIVKVLGGGDIEIPEAQEQNGFEFYKTDKGTAVVTTENGFGGKLKILVGFDNEGTVKGYTILEHAETPGLGAKAGDWFQEGGKGCIVGKNPGTCKFAVTKGNEGDIDGITASTITSRAFLKAIQNAYTEFYANK